MRSRLVAILVLLAIAACTGRPPDAATGEEIFLQLCSNCHGSDLSGGFGPALGPGSGAAERPREYFEVTILEGRGRMPSFRSSLNDEQLDRLIDYIRREQNG